MKKIFLLLSVFLLLSFSAVSDFKEGFADGYCSGYKSVKGQFTVCPVTPVAPVPKAGCNDYDCGYSVGYEKGNKYAKTN